MLADFKFGQRPRDAAHVPEATIVGVVPAGAMVRPRAPASDAFIYQSPVVTLPVVRTRGWYPQPRFTMPKVPPRPLSLRNVTRNAPSCSSQGPGL